MRGNIEGQFEIIQKENTLLVSELELIGKSVGFLITGKNKLSLFNKLSQVDKVEKFEFINCVLSKSKELINFVCSINESLKYSNTLKEITELYNQALN